MSDESLVCRGCGKEIAQHRPGQVCFISKTAQPLDHPGVRAFESGATRSSDAGRYDLEGFLSPLAIERYCIYMQKNQVQPDGSIRSSDNWQKGVPQDAYMKGLLRHTLHLWCRHRGHPVADPKAAADKIEDLCALLFNVQGMLHELLKAKGDAK